MKAIAGQKRVGWEHLISFIALENVSQTKWALSWDVNDKWEFVKEMQKHVWSPSSKNNDGDWRTERHLEQLEKSLQEGNVKGWSWKPGTQIIKSCQNIVGVWTVSRDYWNTLIILSRQSHHPSSVLDSSDYCVENRFKWGSRCQVDPSDEATSKPD